MFCRGSIEETLGGVLAHGPLFSLPVLLFPCTYRPSIFPCRWNTCYSAHQHIARLCAGALTNLVHHQQLLTASSVICWLWRPGSCVCVREVCCINYSLHNSSSIWLTPGVSWTTFVQPTLNVWFGSYLQRCYGYQRPREELFAPVSGQKYPWFQGAYRSPVYGRLASLWRRR